MYKHLHLTAWIILLVFIGLPVAIFASHTHAPDQHACEICDSGGSIPNDPDPEPIYQHDSACPCNECVTKRESPSANNETSLEDVLDSWLGAPKTMLNYLAERYDDFLSIPREYPYYEP